MAHPRILSWLPLVALAGACVENNADSGMVILKNIAPEDGCAVSPESTTFRGSGTIQADSRAGYLFTPLVRNDLATVEGENTTAKTIFVTGAKMTIAFYDPDLFTAAEQTQFQTDGLTRFLVPTSGTIDPDGGQSTFHLEIVPPELLTAIRAKLTAAAPHTGLDVSVQMQGTRSGDSLASNTFRYPVTVCLDCAVQLVGDCASLPSSGTYRAGGACNPVQDGVVDCCTDSTGGLVCPAVPATPPQ